MLSPAVTFNYVGTPNGAAINSYNSTTAPTAAGSYTVTATFAGNYNYNGSSNTANIVINKANLIVKANDATKMYDCNFYAGSAGVTYNSFVNNEAAGVLGGTLTYTVTPTTGTYQNVGTYTITPGGLSSNNYSISYQTGTLTVTPQTAVPVAQTFYTGPAIYWTTSSTSSTATLTLSATIKNSLCGDIRTAKVSFMIRSGTGSFTPIAGAQNLPVGLVNANDQAVGTASANVQYNVSGSAQALDIAVVVTGNYQANDPKTDAVITVAVPKPGGQIVGDGQMCNDNSAGYVKGATGSKSWFGFNVQYNKSLTSMQGGVDITVLSKNLRDGTTDPNNTIHTYKLRSNAISTLSVTGPNASFSGKANVTEIVNGVEQSIEGNCTMQLNIFDGGANGGGTSSTINGVNAIRYDSIAVTVFRSKGGVWYSNNWDGTKTVQAKMCTGDLSTSGTGSTSAPIVAAKATNPTAAPVLEIEPLEVKAYPNPSTNYFTLQLQSRINEKVQLKVFDAAGRPVYLTEGSSNQTYRFGDNFTSGAYFLKVTKGAKQQIVKLIKLK